jgi:putative peptidoglycan lipid II flippase
MAEEKIEEMNNLLNKTLRYLALVIPVSVLLMVLKNEVVLIIYQRGKFDASATALTADILIYLFMPCKTLYFLQFMAASRSY